MSADTSLPAVSPTLHYDALTDKERLWIDTYISAGLSATAASRVMGYKDPRKHGWRMSTNVHIRKAIAERLAQQQIDANEVLYRIDQRARASAEDFLRFDVEVHRPTILRPLTEALKELRAKMEFEDEYVTRAGLDEEEVKGHEERMAAWELDVLRLEMRLERDPKAVETWTGPAAERVVGRFDLAAMRDAGKLHLVKSVKRDKDGGFTVDLHDAAHADDLLAKHAALVGPKGTKDDPLHHKVATVTEIVFNTPEAGAAGDPDAD